MRRSLMAFAASLFIISCTPKEEIARVQAQNDSLRNELITAQNMLYTFKDVSSLIDSIDISRNDLRVNIVEGTPYKDYTARLREINDYVKRSEEKISALEKKLKAARHKSGAYELMVMALKDELSIARDEITALETRVNQIMKDNTDLNKTVKFQQASLEDAQLQLDEKFEEVKAFEVQIKELTDKLEISEANANFAQGQALEKSARKTKLAPKKKRNLYKQALDFYRKAHAAGHPQAADKVKELERKYHNL
jgi:chromosome segregation ATPase